MNKFLFSVFVSFSLFFGNAVAVSVTSFSDVTPKDSAWEAIVEYVQRGIFSGVVSGDGTRFAALDDVILKSHAAIFLAKIIGIPNPSMSDVVSAGILKSSPQPDEKLNHATWIKMLSNAFSVPTGKPASPEMWFVAPFVVAQTVGAVADEKPFDLATRRFVLTTAFKYEMLFGVQNADKMMDDQEKNLMKIRDLLVDSSTKNHEIENLIWKNVKSATKIPENARLDAIRHLNFAAIALLDMRRDFSVEQAFLRRERVNFFLNLAVKSLPDAAPFANDFRKIAENL